MKPWLPARLFWAWLRTPANLLLAIGLLFTALSMGFSYHAITYNSDDVAMQNALLHWRPFSHNIFFGDKDVAFILQAPLYWLVSLVLEPGRRAMFASGLVLSLINFVLVYYASLYFLRVLKIKITLTTLLPLLWVTSFTYALNRIFLGTNLHNITVGLIFVLLMLISKLCRGEIAQGRRITKIFWYVAIAIGTSLAIVNDRYFLYFGVVPAAILIAWRALDKHWTIRQVIAPLILLALGYGVAALVTGLLGSAGMTLLPGVGSPGFASFSVAGTYGINAIHSLLVIMGADFFGQRLFGLGGLLALLNLALLVLALYAAGKLLVTSGSRYLEIRVLSIVFWLILAAYCFSSFNMGAIQTYRYLVIVPFTAALLLAAYCRLKVKNQLVIRIAFTIAIVLNLIASVSGLAPSAKVIDGAIAVKGQSNNQSANYDLIAFLKSADLQKGYSSYWSSAINTYLSKGTVDVLPVKCTKPGWTVPHVWFVDRNSYLKKSKKSFYMFDSNNHPCPQYKVREQFGQPEQEYIFNGKLIWVYGHDIVKDMNTSALNKTE